MLRIAERIAEQDAGGAFVELQGLLDQGLDPQRIALSLTQTFRDLLVARSSSADLVALGLRADLVEETRRIAARSSPEKLTALLALAGRTVAELRRSPRPRLALEVALASMARLEDPGAVAALFARLDALGGSEASGSESAPGADRASREPRAMPSERPPSREVHETRGVPETREVQPSRDVQEMRGVQPASDAHETRDALETPGRSEPSPAPPALDGPHTRLWSDLLLAVRGRKMMLASFLDHGRPVSADDGVLLVAFDNSYHEGIVSRRENLEMIHEELLRVSGQAVAFRVKREAAGARSATERSKAAPVSSKDILGENPGLGRLLDDLGGRLLPGGLGGGGS